MQWFLTNFTAMAASSSSLPSEIEAEHHPYLDYLSLCPKRAYEARQMKEGFYVRVDMPGVPPDGVKLFKYSDSRTVTFTGRAPKHWNFDSSERVYGGYVALDRGPTELEIEMTVKNGSLRLFFPGAEGTLHFFPSKNRAQNAQSLDHLQDNAGLMVFYPCEDSSNDEQYDREPNVILGQVKSIGRHGPKCPCNCEGKRGYLLVSTTKSSYTNPSLLPGVQGVCESKLVDNETGRHLYLRVDMPGIEEKGSILMVNHEHYTVFGEDKNIKYYMIIGGNCPKEHHFDKHLRSYLCGLILQCSCCEIDGIIPSKKDSVFRLLFQKKQNTQETTTPSDS